MEDGLRKLEKRLYGVFTSVKKAKSLTFALGSAALDYAITGIHMQKFNAIQLEANSYIKELISKAGIPGGLILAYIASAVPTYVGLHLTGKAIDSYFDLIVKKSKEMSSLEKVVYKVRKNFKLEEWLCLTGGLAHLFKGAYSWIYHFWLEKPFIQIFGNGASMVNLSLYYIPETFFILYPLHKIVKFKRKKK